MKYLKESFETESFDAFNKIVAGLVEKAARQNQEAMQLLIYLKQQVNPAYREIICPPEELSKGIDFTLADFEKLARLYKEQKAAKEEEQRPL